MRRGMFTRGMASILAFGHTRGLAGQRNARHSYARPVPVREIVPMPLTLTARDMGVTFESDPDLYRAIHPIFTGRERGE
jgi:hypothetical protein